MTDNKLIADLWNTVQAMPEYAGKTSLVLTVDHGRGREGDGWKNHSTDIPGSDEIWMAVLGPDTPALGVRTGTNVTQSQIAATVGARFVPWGKNHKFFFSMGGAYRRFLNNSGSEQKLNGDYNGFVFDLALGRRIIEPRSR